MKKLKTYNIYQTKNKQNKNAEFRKKFLKENLPLKHCSEEEKKIILDLAYEFNDIFHIDGDPNTFTDVAEHKIPLIPNSRPIFVPQYRIPQSQREIVDEHIDQLIKDGVIEPSTSQWNSPIILVPKKPNERGEKQYRLVVDFRRLNEVTETQSFPMPDLEEEISKMGGAKYFSTLDLYSAFHQIPMAEEDKDLTSFQTSNRKFRFKRMPFGLKGSPITWQRTINLILDELLHKNIMAYMDDIIVYNKTLHDHIENLRKLLQRLRKYNLKLKVEKTKFLCKQVKYLSHIISEEGIKTDPEKVSCIQNFVRPTSVVEIQRYLGTCNYYRKYIKDYSKITKPLTNLCKKDVPFVWSQSCEEAFQKLKNSLITAPVLIFPDFKETFYVTTDASHYAVGAVLSQGTYPNDRPIQYFSKTLGPAQINYSVTHKELLSIIMAIEEFRHYLYGREFVVITDHKPLTALFKQNVNGRLQRWKWNLKEYDFKIIHVPGRQNKVADFLSRLNNPTQDSKSDQKLDQIPRSVEEYMKNCEDLPILAALTRSKAKELEILKRMNEQESGQNSLENEQNTVDSYPILENNNSIIFRKNFDHVFHLFENECCELRNKLEDKWKKRLKVESPMNKYQLYSIDKYNSIIIVPKIIRNSEQIEITKIVLKQILEFSEEKFYERIALNISFADVPSYFEFKNLYKQLFKNTNINTSFYLNKIIEVERVEDIQNILDIYHKSLLGGHVGIDRMKNNIRRFYNWENMTRDFKTISKIVLLAKELKFRNILECLCR